MKKFFPFLQEITHWPRHLWSRDLLLFTATRENIFSNKNSLKRAPCSAAAGQHLSVARAYQRNIFRGLINGPYRMFRRRQIWEKCGRSDHFFKRPCQRHLWSAIDPTLSFHRKWSGRVVYTKSNVIKIKLNWTWNTSDHATTINDNSSISAPFSGNVQHIFTWKKNIIRSEQKKMGGGCAAPSVALFSDRKWDRKSKWCAFSLDVINDR